MLCREYRSHFSLRIRDHHRSSHECLRVVTIRGEGKGETVVTTPDRLDRFSYLKRLQVQVS
jgi:hypothetical protein